MSKPISFSGLNIYKVIEVAKVEYSKTRKNIFTGKTKTTELNNKKHTIFVVANSRESAIKKYKERCTCWEVGGKVIGYKDFKEYEDATVKETRFDIYYADLTAKQLYENVPVEDYVKYMTFLQKGFKELINPNFEHEEDRDENRKENE